MEFCHRQRKAVSEECLECPGFSAPAGIVEVWMVPFLDALMHLGPVPVISVNDDGGSVDGHLACIGHVNIE